MNCKNCKVELNPKDSFCIECGASIVKEKITINSLFSNLLDTLGWDSNFFVTLRYLFYKPQIVSKEYIDGVRKKYTNPFAFFAIGLAVSFFFFSQYSEQFIEMSIDTSSKLAEMSTDVNDDENSEIFGYKNQQEFNKSILKFQMKYYNLISFLQLPLITILAFLVFRKPYNFGEHLVINTYLQGIILFLSILLFIFSILTGINIFGTGTIILPIFYYSYTYKKLNKLTFSQLLLKILKFIFILLVFGIIFISIILLYFIINNKTL